MMTSSVDNADVRNSKQVLRLLNLPAVYDADPRPTFIIERSDCVQNNSPAVIYSNLALNRRGDLLSNLSNALHEHTGFRSWVLLNSQEHYYQYGGAMWYGFELHGQWKVVGLVSESHADRERPHASSSFGSCHPSLSTEEHTACEASINQLKEEIRAYESQLQRTTMEKQSCLECVRRLKEELYVSDSSRRRAKLLRSSSGESVPTLTKPSTAPRGFETWSLSDSVEGTMERTGPYYQHMHEHEPTSFPPPSPALSTTKVIAPVRITSEGDHDASVALAKFQQLAEAVDVGFFDYDPTGKLLHANESWYELSGHPREPELHTVLSFNKCVYPDDAELVMQQWDKLMQGQAVTFEMRWKKSPSFSAGSGNSDDAQWVLAACVPVIGEDGTVQSISGCTTDINAQKQRAQVALQRAEALERARASEERFSRFAEVAPIAIFRFDKQKKIEYCNDRWFEMTGTPKTRFDEIQWQFGVYEDDIEMCSQAWEKSIADHSIGQIEFRLRKEWHDARGRRGHAWVYCTFFAEFAEDGSFNGLMGSLLDISHLKWAENMQKLRAEEALEAKRQQENFIDITSHEMRNPLSAMVQCADSIMISLTDIAQITARTPCLGGNGDKELLQEHVDTGLDAVQTILSCAAHQRRIVDDILTLSKLDSNLLLITPVRTNPIEMVQGVIKMFEMDSSKADVELTYELGQSFKDLGVQWLLLDPSRVSQILINLLGNAIKFTRSEKTRKVSVSMSVTLEPPSKGDLHIDYVPAESVIDDLGEGIDGGEGEPIYLKFEVQDTGRGLTSDEKEKLFMRFSQASPKTHVQYGGSGLGLFISRKLTEMQGGEIGFASEAYVGSTFAFYIKSKRTIPPVANSGSFTQANMQEVDPVPASEISKKKLSVLLVEDNIVNQKVLGKQLQRQGCDVFVAGQGGEAIDFLKTTELWSRSSTVEGAAPGSDRVCIDVVLMDIEMPVMGGLECTRRIRKFEEEKSILKHLPIISISANARQEQVDEALLAGVDDTITKPFRIQELMPKIYRLGS